MNEPEPADSLPDGPLSEAEAAALLDRPTADGVWVMDHGQATRRSILGDNPPDDAVIELVIETDEGFEMYSYTHTAEGTQWVTYGTQPKDGSFAETLASYRLLAGQTATAMD